MWKLCLAFLFLITSSLFAQGTGGFGSGTVESFISKDKYETAGNILLYAMPSFTAIMTLAGYKNDSNSLKKYELAALVDEVIVFDLKSQVHEERPNKKDYFSFPSGHASTTFTVASFLWVRYGWQYGLPATVLASFTGWSRVESKEHYWHDVFAGSALGIVCGITFTTLKGVTISSVTTSDQVGAIMTIPF